MDTIATRDGGIFATVGGVVYWLRLADPRRALWDVSRADGRGVGDEEADRVLRRAEELALLRFRGEPE